MSTSLAPGGFCHSIVFSLAHFVNSLTPAVLCLSFLVTVGSFPPVCAYLSGDPAAERKRLKIAFACLKLPASLAIFFCEESV